MLLLKSGPTLGPRRVVPFSPIKLLNFSLQPIRRCCLDSCCCCMQKTVNEAESSLSLRGEWPSGLYSLRQVTEVKLGRVRSISGWVTSEA